ncbi:hypothetical protein [Ectothiorhodospira sp. BSL-9]|uniref:hypothetical protein n=1 Tax=Ectothiorhodospira sp. BSL-9 TaxID=1442136 RepID=UPI0012E91384|nr:hypothetical protein [Ectothiorhodospira sp. BSL-9]
MNKSLSTLCLGAVLSCAAGVSADEALHPALSPGVSLSQWDVSSVWGGESEVGPRFTVGPYWENFLTQGNGHLRALDGRLFRESLDYDLRRQADRVPAPRGRMTGTGIEAVGGYQLGYVADRVRYDLVLGVGYDRVRQAWDRGVRNAGRVGGFEDELHPVFYTRIGAGPVFETEQWRGRLHMGLKYPLDLDDELDLTSLMFGQDPAHVSQYHSGSFVNFSNLFLLGGNEFRLDFYYDRYRLSSPGLGGGGLDASGLDCLDCGTGSTQSNVEIFGIEMGVNF